MNDVTNLFAKEDEVDDATREAIGDAIRKAYPNRDFFYMRLHNKWGVDVEDDVTSLDNPGGVVMARIVQYARANGRQLDLLALAWADVPGNPALKALANNWLTPPEAALAKYAPPPLAAPPPQVRPTLEKLVAKRSRLINLQAFQQRLAGLSGALCRIQAAGIKGTGFLIGRHTVLTNYHVVKAAIAADTQGDQIFCEFDYYDANIRTVLFNGAMGIDWLDLNSPYSESDLTGKGVPGPDELDFALITLSQDVEPARRPVTWPTLPPVVSQRDFVLICQHPGGEPAKLAMGEVLDYPGGLRYRYDVTTESGSSGSPVFDVDLNLVALHHAADPTLFPQYNQGVPIARIMAALKAAKIDPATL
ncbi:trypsin-like peptidase domain-containing protein [Asticcacaulis benevestitus]|uniref:Effector-associated domain-containing protein n=1 Tax=Asticcacaulis benevestitus DSM 16100 = ATCC BAA-896 TaxID=1121022 RepID=V4PF73_9CAUL|nr:trypsin-like peptidase domain-containing protein [Asticcacaulis benevestitus]ESQ92602.1 hypothetical protein ABENE_08165 [Asticcacaulis benevestitus DSM 16100 = ATCC BAA-896]